jgi:hypothetical protein
MRWRCRILWPGCLPLLLTAVNWLGAPFRSVDLGEAHAISSLYDPTAGLNLGPIWDSPPGWEVIHCGACKVDSSQFRHF